MLVQHCVFIILNVIINTKCANILCVVPSPSISHQKAFRPLIQALVKRGHEVTSITTDPMYEKGLTPDNLTEIDLHDISYSYVMNTVSKNNRNNVKPLNQMKHIIKRMLDVVDAAWNENSVKNILNSGTKYDLLLIEGFVRCALGFSHVFKAPVILISSFGAFPHQYDMFGVPTQPLVYPFFMQTEVINNSSFVDKIKTILINLEWQEYMRDLEETEYRVMRKYFGEDVPSYEELYKNVQMVLINFYTDWVNNLPIPLSIKNVGGQIENPENSLSQELQSFMESSVNGVIYVSLGTNISPSLLSSEKINIMLDELSKMPYGILFKWDSKEFPRQYPRIKFSEWFSQSDLLKHPNMKLFITQCGLQSTDEAIDAGVPLLGIPIFADQFYNVEKYMFHGIGLRLDFNSLTKEGFRYAIHNITGDSSYKRNILALQQIRKDVKTKPLELAVWWSEYVIKYGGNHMKSPAFNLAWTEYYEIDLILIVFLCVAVLITGVLLVIKYAILIIVNIVIRNKKK